MKLAKKIIAALSSVAMIATFTSALVAHAADVPVITPVLTETSDGVYNLAINVNTSGCTDSKLYSVDLFVNLDNAIFDMENGPWKTESYYDEDEEEYVETKPNIAYSKAALTPKAENYTKNQYIYVWYEAKGTANSNTAGANIVTLKNLKIRDGVTTNDVVITIGEKSEITAGSTTYKYANMEVSSVTFPGNKIDATPEPTVAPTAEPTVAPTAEPTVAPTAEPTVAPTAEPTVAPTAEPTVEPTAAPIAPVEYTGDVDEGDSSKVTDKTLAWTFDVPVLEGQHSIIFKIWNSADPSHKWQKVVTDEVKVITGNVKVGLLFTFNPEDPDYIAKFGNVKMDSGIAIAE